MKRIFPTLFILILLSSCSPSLQQSERESVIYTTIYPIHFLVDELIGQEIEVISVYPPGVDAHSYEPTTREMLEIASGEAFFYLGAGMEGFTDTAKSALKNSDVSFIEIGKNEQLFKKSQISDEHGDFDPHIWFDPLRMITMAEIIRDDLITFFPEQTDHINENLSILKENLHVLDSKFQQSIAQGRKKHIIVSHGAYEYWEERFGIIQIPISGLTATEEPSQKELAKIIELAEMYQLHAVFFEQNASNKTADIIRNHIGAEKLYIHNLEVLVSEDLEAEENYYSLMEKNLNELMKGIQ